MGRSYVSRLAFPGVQEHTEVPENASWFRRVETANLSVPCLLIEHERPRATLLYLHGNAMAISEMLPLTRAFSAALSCHVVAPEIPGTQYDWGRTAFKDGVAREASEGGYYEAALGAFDWAQKTFPDLPVVVYGQSLGTGAACEVCVRREAAALVLQSPLLSAVRVAFPSLFTIPFTDIFVSIAKAPDIKCATLVVHGARDRVIGVTHGRRLAQAVSAKHLHEYAELPEADHNDVELLYWDTLVAKIDSLISSVISARN